MASGSSNNFVPLPFFVGEEIGADKKDKPATGFNSFELPATAPSVSAPPKSTGQYTTPSSEATLPTDFFSSNFAASSSFFTPSSVNTGSNFNYQESVQPSTSAVPESSKVAATPVKVASTPVATKQWEPSFQFQTEAEPPQFNPFPPASIPESPRKIESGFEMTEVHKPATAFSSFNQFPNEAGPSEPASAAPFASEPWNNNFKAAPKIEIQTPFSYEPLQEPWKQTGENNAFAYHKETEQPSHVSWQQNAATLTRRNSNDSQRSNQPPHLSGHQPHLTLDGIDETTSIRSFTNSSFVIEGGKVCDRCGKQNEMLANFCCRCGSQIASPIESPADSQVFSIDSNAVVLDRMGKLSISDNKQLHPTAQQSFVPPEPFNSAAPAFPQHSSSFYQPQAQQFQPQQQQLQSLRKTSAGEVTRTFPVISFGFGGTFLMTFPTLQTRYNPSGQPINSYRPSVLYKGDISMLPMAKEKAIDRFKRIDEGAPILEKALKPKELATLVTKLRADALGSSDELLYGLFELLLQSGGKLPETSKLLEQLRAILPAVDDVQQLSPSGQSPTSAFVLNEVSKQISCGNLPAAATLALENQLWSHALILGQFSGPEFFRHAVAEFVKQDFPPCHPMRLSYLLLSGQPKLIEQELLNAGPAISKTWPSILLALMANRKSSIDNAVLITLGDALARHADPIASQFCYLLSQDDSIFSTGRVKLLGRNDFIHVLRLTEIYEAVRNSSNPGFCLPHLFPLKFAYITMLLELGLNSLALRHSNALGSLLKKSQWKDGRFLEAYESLVNRLEVFAEGDPSITVPSGAETSGWFPKVGGLMDVLDRSLNKVIGVDGGSGSSSPSKRSAKSPIMPQVDVAIETTSSPTNRSSSYITPVGGFDPFSSNGSIEARVSPPHQPWRQQETRNTSFGPGDFGIASTLPFKDATESYIQRHEAAVETINQAPPSVPAPVRSQAWSPEPQQPQQQFGSAPSFAPQQFMPSAPAVGQFNPTPSFTPHHQQQQADQGGFSGGFAGFNPQQPVQPQQPLPNEQQSFSAGFNSQAQVQEQQQKLFSPQTSPGQQHGGFNPQQYMANQPQQQPQQGYSNFEPQQQQQQQPQQPSPHLMHQASMPNLPSAAVTEPSIDDFGFGNAASMKNKAEAPSAKEIGHDSDNKDSDAGSKGSLIGSFIGGLFRRKQNSSSPALSSGSAGSGASGGSNFAQQANLGESEMKLVYDETKKQWVRKDTGAPPVAETAAPPPPPAAMMSSGGSQGNNSDNNASPVSYRRGQASGARGRYVDAFGGDSTIPASTAPRANLIPTPSFTNLSLGAQDSFAVEGAPVVHQQPQGGQQQQQFGQQFYGGQDQYNPSQQQHPQQMSQYQPQPQQQQQQQFGQGPVQYQQSEQYGHNQQQQHYSYSNPSASQFTTY